MIFLKARLKEEMLEKPESKAMSMIRAFESCIIAWARFLGGHTVLCARQRDAHGIFARLQLLRQLGGVEKVHQAVGLGGVLLLFQRVEHIGQKTRPIGNKCAGIALFIHRHSSRHLAHMKALNAL